MAKRYFTLAVVMLLSICAAAQINSPCSDCAVTVGITNKAPEGDTPVYIELPMMNVSANDPAFSGNLNMLLNSYSYGQDSASPDTGGSSSGSAGQDANAQGELNQLAAGAQYGNFLGMGIFNSAKNLVGTTLKGGAVIGAAAVGGVPAGIGVLISLFPQYAPGANCPNCAIAMVAGPGPTPEPFYNVVGTESEFTLVEGLPTEFRGKPYVSQSKIMALNNEIHSSTYWEDVDQGGMTRNSDHWGKLNTTTYDLKGVEKIPGAYKVGDMWILPHSVTAHVRYGSMIPPP